MFTMILIACQTAVCTPATSLTMRVVGIPTLEACRAVAHGAADAFKAGLPGGMLSVVCVQEKPKGLPA
jgi:hypothetical protein